MGNNDKATTSLSSVGVVLLPAFVSNAGMHTAYKSSPVFPKVQRWHARRASRFLLYLTLQVSLLGRPQVRNDRSQNRLATPADDLSSKCQSLLTRGHNLV